ncbi:hypothetical protein C8J56DRAFT_1050523 [Mycena floridula]|nr:hypothetical protein C8J56DRAFT_1050523 [Mycena floridula]
MASISAPTAMHVDLESVSDSFQVLFIADHDILKDIFAKLQDFGAVSNHLQKEYGWEGKLKAGERQQYSSLWDGSGALYHEEPISIKEYWDEFSGLAYKEDDILYGDLRKIFGKGSKVTTPWTLDDQQLAEGLSIAQSTEGLVQQDGKWVWPSDLNSPVYWARHSTAAPSSVVISKPPARSDDISDSSAMPRHADESNLRHSTTSDLFSKRPSHHESSAKDMETGKGNRDDFENQVQPTRDGIPPQLYSPIPRSIHSPRI